jgi:cytoskeletal protein RodZ
MSAESAALGALLRAARDRRGLSLQQIASETKIPRRQLEALERGDLSALPAGAYRRGEVIAFAEAVGLDRKLVLEHFERAIRAGQSPAQDVATVASLPRSRVRSNAPFLVLAALVAAVAVAWFVQRPATSVYVPRAHPAESSSPAPAPNAETALSRAPDAQPAAAAPEIAAPVAAVQQQVEEKVTTEPARVPVERSRGRAEDGINTGSSSPVSGSVQTSASTKRALVIATEPPGARVTVNGIGWGEAPLSLDQLPPGPKQIRVTLEGYAAQSRTVHLRESGTTRVLIPLRPLPTR